MTSFANDDEGVTYEVYAVRYASVERRSVDNFLVRDIHDGPMALDFYFWLLRGGGRTIMVDTGFSACSAQERERQFSLEPKVALDRLGVTPDMVDDVILTHLHYDHAGNVDAYPNAIVHLQEAEMHYATGRYMCFHALRHFFAVEDVASVLRRVYAGKVQFYDGQGQVRPGVDVYRVGGHTAGLQVVRVRTVRGWIVLASDAMHYYGNYERDNPFPGIFHVGEMLEGYRQISALADTSDHIVAGHDPLVGQMYPPLSDDGIGIFRLHEAPKHINQDTK